MLIKKLFTYFSFTILDRFQLLYNSQFDAYIISV